MEAVIPFRGDMFFVKPIYKKNDIAWLNNEKKKKKKKMLYIQSHRFHSFKNIIKQLGYG
jgi:CRISPR/Cas system CSM-associated protein Csm4 (group 5 of RAMP superfamily)